jgi:addiction module HigA family antidote
MVGALTEPICTNRIGTASFPAYAPVLKIRRATLSDLLHGQAIPTPEMALRIEKAFGPDMNHLLRMQLAYDIAQMRRRAGKIAVDRYVPA